LRVYSKARLIANLAIFMAIGKIPGAFILRLPKFRYICLIFAAANFGSC